MRTTFVNVLLKKVEENKNIELLTGDLGFGVLKEFMEKYPDHFTNCGIAEQNMLTVAGGMASMGKCVVVYSIGNFPTFRALEQIRNDICYYNHNVKIICIGGGYTYGSLGMSHHATEDVAIMRAMPHMHIFTPSTKEEARLCAEKMFDIEGPCYLRLERDCNILPSINPLTKDVFALQERINRNSKTLVLTYGTILEEVVNAVSDKTIDVYTVPTLKPFDEKGLLKLLENHENVVIVEEHSVIGGLGDIVTSIIAKHSLKKKIISIGINDEFTSAVGNQHYLRGVVGIDEEAIIKRLKDENIIS